MQVWELHWAKCPSFLPPKASIYWAQDWLSNLWRAQLTDEAGSRIWGGHARSGAKAFQDRAANSELA